MDPELGYETIKNEQIFETVKSGEDLKIEQHNITNSIYSWEQSQFTEIPIIKTEPDDTNTMEPDLDPLNMKTETDIPNIKTEEITLTLNTEPDLLFANIEPQNILIIETETLPEVHNEERSIIRLRKEVIKEHPRHKDNSLIILQSNNLVSSPTTDLGRVHNELTALRFFQEFKILPRELNCANGHKMKLAVTSRKSIWRCSTRSCVLEGGIRPNTWLEKSKLPFKTILHFIYFWSKEISSIRFCTKELGMSQSAVIEWNNFLREICVWKLRQMDANSKMIGGVDMVVEINQKTFFCPKKKDGTHSPQTWLFGGLCRTTKECFIVKVRDRAASTLMPIIRQYVRVGSTIITDLWQDYRRIEASALNNHTAIQRYNFVDSVTLGEALPEESMWDSYLWSNFRRRGTSRKVMDSYLSELMWRARLNDQDPCNAILEDIALFRPIKCGSTSKHERPSNLNLQIIPFFCEECGFECTKKSEFNKHLQTHSAVKPYACSNCTLKFAEKKNLKKHNQLKHAGDDQYSCQECKFKCTRKGGLVAHNMQIHNNKKHPHRVIGYCVSEND